eukprot:TRINITY_DN29020_c0_g2_i1.p1 TRINITY_DN29020_c0_g2~~TRINITY_DN29020_c0_g2_i1.p1  ORF type:complete len:641 (+),score=119.33 TRINITY_DN29020_c0_g2_i1:61-1983(+)
MERPGLVAEMARRYSATSRALTAAVPSGVRCGATRVAPPIATMHPSAAGWSEVRHGSPMMHPPPSSVSPGFPLTSTTTVPVPAMPPERDSMADETRADISLGAEAVAAPSAVDPRSAEEEEMRELLKAALQDSPEDLGELDLPCFCRLMNLVVPNMSNEEITALFRSMDKTSDGLVKGEDLLSDMAVSVLCTRLSNQGSLHPLEGAYRCLPSRHFLPDERQLKAIETLKVVYDEVLTASKNPCARSPAPRSMAAPPQPVVPARTTLPSFAAFAAGAAAALRQARGAQATKRGGEPPRASAGRAPISTAPRGAYLYGGCGCGKTVLLDLFYRSLPEGFGARRLHWHEFIRDAFRQMRGSHRGGSVYEAMGDKFSKQFRVLLLDELLVTHITEAVLVKSLFREMWANGITIITTSNYRPDELYAGGFNRDQFEDFIPELAQQCQVIDMAGGMDYRTVGASASTASRFYYPINAVTTEHFNNHFETLVQGASCGGDVLEIAGEKRHIVVPYSGFDVHGASVAKFSFTDLCAGNLGRAEYSTLAERFRTLFIAGVPRFSPDLGAEFRRFVALTDILYGKKVAVYMQCEVPVDDLFVDAAHNLDIDEAWAFRRCSSMLTEMQDPKYQHMVWLMRNHLLQESALRL